MSICLNSMHHKNMKLKYDDDNLDMDEEGFVMKGRTMNYTNAEDVLIYIAWKSLLMHSLALSKPRTRTCNASRSTSMSAALAATFAQGTVFVTLGHHLRRMPKVGRLLGKC